MGAGLGFRVDSDLGLGSGQLTTMHFWTHCRPGCLVALADSEGCNPSPSLQVAEMITLITGLQRSCSPSPTFTSAAASGGRHDHPL